VMIKELSLAAFFKAMTPLTVPVRTPDKEVQLDFDLGCQGLTGYRRYNAK
jgi:hypothetical protein